MGLTTTVQGWMRDVGARERSVVIARTHVAAETSTDVDAICATVSPDVFFGVPVRTRAGNELPPGTVLTTYDQVRGYYEGRSGTYVVVDSMQLKTVATEWYVFNESAATLRGTGAMGGVDVTGKELVVNSAVLFPTAPDGIRGEICITRYPFDDIAADTVERPPPLADPRVHLPLREMQNCGVVDRLVAAMRHADHDGIGETLSGSHSMAVRLDDRSGAPTVHTATDRAEAAAALLAMADDIDDITLLTRIATDWYVFVESLVKLGRGGVRRLALIHAVEGGVLTSTFGYGWEEG